MAERWAQIHGVANGYEISDHGTVRHGPRELKKTIDKHGYERIPLRQDGKVILPTIHRLVATHFNGECPAGYVVAHLDGTRRNNHFSNLAFVTVAENNRHKTIHLTQQSGSRHGMSRLKDEEVEEILRLIKPGDREFGVKGMAARFGIGSGTVRKILRGETWRDSTRALSLKAEIERLKVDNDRLRAALEPFADEAKTWDVAAPDEYVVKVKLSTKVLPARFTVGDLRRARAALDAIKEG